MNSIAICVLQLFFVINCFASKKAVKYNQTDPAAKFDNPNYVRDRFKNVIMKPEMPESWKNRFRKPFHPAWMDYCDPYHCNDYHKIACGLNRKNMRFKWFQSVCHIILNNQCATYRGALKYDVVDTKYCMIYVMYLRTGCPVSCEEETIAPVCGISRVDHHIVLFINACALEKLNCNSTIREYDAVNLDECFLYIAVMRGPKESHKVDLYIGSWYGNNRKHSNLI